MIGAFRRRPLRSLVVLAVVIYLLGLMVVLTIGLFLDPGTTVIRESP